MTPDEIKQRLSAAGLRVKPLEWREIPETEGFWHEADCPFGTYRVRLVETWDDYFEETRKRFLFVVDTPGHGEVLPDAYDTFGEAKAAAQADHDRRMYEALMEDEFDIGTMDTFDMEVPNDPT